MILNKRKSIYFLIFLNLPIVIISVIYNLFFEGGLISECVFRETFGLYCPGCGGSRAVNSLLKFNLLRSFLYYPPILLCAALILFLDVRLAVFLFRKNQKSIKVSGKIFLIIKLRIIDGGIIRKIFPLTLIDF